MLLQYINIALKKAKYETLDNGSVYGEIQELQGVWAEGKTFEDCRNELVEVIEEWVFLKLRDNDEVPVLDGINLNSSRLAHAS